MAKKIGVDSVSVTASALTRMGILGGPCPNCLALFYRAPYKYQSNGKVYAVRPIIS